MVKDNRDVDQGYAWVVLAASFGIEVTGGILYGCAGFITGAIVEEVDSNLTRSSLVISIMLGTFTLFGPLAGLIQDRIGHRLTGIISGVLMLIGLTAASFCRTIPGLVLTFGIITGVGLGLALNLSGVAPGSYFDKKLPVVYGICVSGGGLGLFIVGPLTVFLLELYNISGTFLILGSIAFHVCLAGALIRPRAKTDTVEDISISVGVGSTDDEGRETETEIPVITDCDISQTDLNDEIAVSSMLKIEGLVEHPATLEPLFVEKEHSQGSDTIQPRCLKNPVINSLRKCFFLLRNNGLFLYAVSILFSALGESACMIHLPNYLMHKGSTAVQAGNILAGMGVVCVVSGILAGFAASDQSIPKILLHVGFQGLSGMLNILLPLFSHTYSLQMLFGTLYGIYSQAPYSLVGPICIELAGLSNLAAAYGLTSFFLGIGYLIGPPFASLLYEASGVYDYTYVFAGCSMVTSAVCAAFIPMFKQKQKAESDV